MSDSFESLNESDPIKSVKKQEQKDLFDEDIYRPLSILPLTSKVFQKAICSTWIHYFADSNRLMVLSMHFSECYRHGKRNLINVGTVLMDLSKACDCLPHDLMIAKLEAKGFHSTSLKSFHSFLSNRNQRVKIGSAISEWIDILTAILRSSIHGPLIFNIFISDLMMFIEKTHICNFADDNTLYKSSPNLTVVQNSLGHDILIALN